MVTRGFPPRASPVRGRSGGSVREGTVAARRGARATDYGDRPIRSGTHSRTPDRPGASPGGRKTVRGRTASERSEVVEMGEGRTPRPEPFARDQLRACPMCCRRSAGRPSATCRRIQSRLPSSGLTPGYVTLTGVASSLHDASTTREEEVASTLTLLPKQRGREQAGGCQLLRFAACFTRPDGTSARVP